MSEKQKHQLSEEAMQTLEERRDERFNQVRRRHWMVMILLLIPIFLLSVRTVEEIPPIVLQPDYPLVEDEPNAHPSHDQEEQMHASQGGGAVALIYSDEVTYSLAADRLTLSYTNPSSSTAGVILQIILYGPNGAEYLLAESGALRPGFGVEVLDGDLDDRVSLTQGIYNGAMRVLFYNYETGEKAIVNTEIPVKITVQ